MTENDLYEQLAQYLTLKHPELDGLWHFDTAGLWTPSHKLRNLYGRLNRRAWPDLMIPVPVFMPGSTEVYSGLFIELKRSGTRLKKRDGSWANEHIAEQASMLDDLRARGYIAQFAVGLTEATELIESYLSGKPLIEVMIDASWAEELDDESPF